jgi:hypothetical protein
LQAAPHHHSAKQLVENSAVQFPKQRIHNI